jgi:hypothetical protein
MEPDLHECRRLLEAIELMAVSELVSDGGPFGSVAEAALTRLAAVKENLDKLHRLSSSHADDPASA